MLVRTTPFRTVPARDFDSWAHGLLGSVAAPVAPALMPMDVWRAEQEVVLEVDLPGVDPGTISLDADHRTLTITAERPARAVDAAALLTERPRGKATRQLTLGDDLDPTGVQAAYDNGVLTLKIPVSEKAKPRRIAITAAGAAPSGLTGEDQPQAITA